MIEQQQSVDVDIISPAQQLKSGRESMSSHTGSTRSTPSTVQEERDEIWVTQDGTTVTTIRTTKVAKPKTKYRTTHSSRAVVPIVEEGQGPEEVRSPGEATRGFLRKMLGHKAIKPEAKQATATAKEPTIRSAGRGGYAKKIQTGKLYIHMSSWTCPAESARPQEEQ